MDIAEKAGRLYSEIEHRSDAVVHVLGIVFAINASLWLLWHVTGLPVLVSVSVYCAGLLAMISFSAAYNMWPHHRPSKQVLRRLDHAAIFIMIAATYTPFAVNRLGYPDGDVILAVIWGLATVGVVLKVLFPYRFEKSSLALYLAMGWLVVAGGLVYSAGVIFYVWERIPHHKTIWHAAVLVAAVLHFSAISLEFGRV